MIEEIVGDLTPTRAALWFLGLFTAFCVFRKFQASAQIASGCSCSQALDFIYKGHVANLKHADIEFWNDTIMAASGRDNCKTAEVDAGISTRVVLTKDPENIKALLTG